MSEPARDPAPCGASFSLRMTCAMPSASAPSIPGPARNPLVGVGAGLRHARFHLHEFCRGVRGGPGASRRSRSTARPESSRCRENRRRRRSHSRRGPRSNVGSAAWPKLSRFAWRSTASSKGSIPDCRRRAVGFQESLDQFVALAAAEAASERPASRVDFDDLQRGQMRGQLPSAHRPR